MSDRACDPSSPGDGRYVDRETGELRTEQLVRRGLFHWLYNAPTGRRVRPLLLHSRLLHSALGWYADQPGSRRWIPGFVRAARVNVAESERPPACYPTFNDFFARRLDPRARPLDPDPATLVSPGDGKLLVLPEVGPRSLLSLKGVTCGLAELLADPSLASRYAGGAAAVLRLYLGDYHRLHFPTGGLPRAPRRVPGRFYSVSPFPGNNLNFYGRNQRAVTLLESDGFGLLAFVDVGGFLISSIRHCFTPGRPVRKGEEKSFFAFGGSTLVLVAERGRVRWDDDLVAASAGGLETYVKLGTRIGRIP
ncbi:MAG: phosphatidylserine decarboxylase [Planctomycetes bacterium]|nr:phosphatidylserine decarboxylase [Planctomycetota bacterium]